MKIYRVEDIERFYLKVAVSGPDSCWEWIEGKDRQGYGRFEFNGKNQLAHRFAYYIATGHDPGDLFVCHSCDNAGCVNPKHLWLGTCKENMQDAARKGRMARGERARTAKLTESDVLHIRERYAAGGIIYQELADKYGVNSGNICQVVNRRTWTHVKEIV